ncbi:YafY family protein [Limnohabitans sp. 2KL-3]|uniref:helix-turn-helix transcriptional regulator n=1 Tax=Limnohabitans sp. 2KL-3 TaxID=1100700 RepID=UPI000AEE8BC2|nr:WYL domain-containing protein [Limnohabitans sp. 2KL-3]
MKFSEALAVLRLLGTRHEDAMTVQDIVAKWDNLYSEKLHKRTAQRYLSELSTGGIDGRAVIEVDTTSKERRYHLRVSEMANWLMTDEAALYHLLSLQVLQSTFGNAVADGLERQMDIAEHLTQEQRRTKRLRDRVRIVPDGIGRLRAKISSEILGCVMDALASKQLLRVEYRSAAGNNSDNELNPLGLVAKDGTLYLLAVKGLCDQPIAYPLQRMKAASVVPLPAQERGDFDLDHYIEASHQLSHVVDATLDPKMVKLKVAPEWIYHFKERPLSHLQEIRESQNSDDWIFVIVPLPITILLKAFLVSFGPGLEVIEPQSLRQDIGLLHAQAAARYSEDLKP